MKEEGSLVNVNVNVDVIDLGSYHLIFHSWCLNMFVLFSVCSLKLFHRLLLIEFGHFYSLSNVKQLEIDNFYILQKIFSYYLVFTDSFSEMLNIY